MIDVSIKNREELLAFWESLTPLEATRAIGDLHERLQQKKSVHPELRQGYDHDPLSILCAYLDGDVGLREAVNILTTGNSQGNKTMAAPPLDRPIPPAAPDYSTVMLPKVISDKWTNRTPKDDDHCCSFLLGNEIAAELLLYVNNFAEVYTPLVVVIDGSMRNLLSSYVVLPFNSNWLGVNAVNPTLQEFLEVKCSQTRAAKVSLIIDGVKASTHDLMNAEDPTINQPSQTKPGVPAVNCENQCGRPAMKGGFRGRRRAMFLSPSAEEAWFTSTPVQILEDLNDRLKTYYLDLHIRPNHLIVTDTMYNRLNQPMTIGGMSFQPVRAYLERYCVATVCGGDWEQGKHFRIIPESGGKDYELCACGRFHFQPPAPDYIFFGKEFPFAS